MSCAGFEVSDQERTANPHILVRVALVIAGAPRQTAAPVSCGIELEPADEQVDYAVGIAHEPFASSNRQLIDRADGEDMLAVEVIRTVVHLRIDVGVSAIVTQVLRPGVVSNELQTVVEPLVQLGLQGIVVSGASFPKKEDPATSRSAQSRVAVHFSKVRPGHRSQPRLAGSGLHQGCWRRSRDRCFRRTPVQRKSCWLADVER